MQLVTDAHSTTWLQLYGCNVLNLGNSKIISVHNKTARQIIKDPHFHGDVQVRPRLDSGRSVAVTTQLSNATGFTKWGVMCCWCR